MPTKFKALTSIVFRYYCKDSKIHKTYKTLTIDNVNKLFKTVKYGIRGPVFLRSVELSSDLAKGIEHPFKELYQTSVGDAHALKQPPVTFMRQVLSITTYPRLKDEFEFPKDVVERADFILNSCYGGSIGSYTHPFGLEGVRKHIAEYYTKRDQGIKADFNNIILGNGATTLIKLVIGLFGCSALGKTGILVPVPEYPLYTSLTTEYDVKPIFYYLDEPNKWAIAKDNLKEVTKKAKDDDISPRAIVVINPGNPTGQVLTQSNLEEIVKFAHEENLALIADEVYQENVWDPESSFHSMRKIIHNMGEPYRSMELFSFQSLSKGFYCECGLRGGILQLTNIDPEVRIVINNMLYPMLCSSTHGQAGCEVLANPPMLGEPSYELFKCETNELFQNFTRRASMVCDVFNKMEGLSCNPIQGAMYTFAKLDLPEKLISEAKSLGREPDTHYCMMLIEQTGIHFIPGTAFSQLPGTYHFRTNILAPEKTMEEILEKFKVFHEDLMLKYK